MRNARWKQPKVALPDIADETFTLAIDRGNSCLAVEHDGPLGRYVPMQLPHAPGSEAHLDSGDRLRDGQFPRRNLARPSAALDSFARQGEGILEGRHGTIVGVRTPDRTRVFCVQGCIL